MIKTQTGTQKRKVFSVKQIMTINKQFIESEAIAAKIAKEAAIDKQGATFIGKQENKVVNVTTEDVKSRLGRFTGGAGEIIDGDASEE